MVASAVAAGQLWLAVEAVARRGTLENQVPVDVLRVDPGSFEVTSILPPGGIDITEHRWPLGAPPVDADSDVDFWRAR